MPATTRCGMRPVYSKVPTMRDDRRFTGERGTTVTELLAVLAIMGVLAVPIAMMLHSAGRTERSSAAQLDIDRQVERAADRLREDLRHATVDPASLRGLDASVTLLLAATDAGRERSISWTVVDDNLQRSESATAAPSVVADTQYGTIEQPLPPEVVFAYFDEQGNELRVDQDTNASCIALVKANFTVVDKWAERATSVVVAPRRGTNQLPC